MNRLFQLGIIIVSLIYLFYHFNFSKINWDLFNVYGLIITFVVILLGQIILSIRWQKIMNISFKIAFETIIISSFLNMILPAKLGEITKIAYLKKTYYIPINKITAALFVERFFDIIILSILMLIFFYLYFQNGNIKSFIIILIILIMFIGIFFKVTFFKKFLKKIPIKFIRVYSQKIYFNINKTLKSPNLIILYTLILWSIYFFSNVVFFMYGVKFQLNLSQIFELFLFSTIVLSISITPGSIATYEAAIVFILGKYGIDKENALIAAVLYHSFLYLVDFLLFGLLLLVKDFKLKNIIRIK